MADENLYQVMGGTEACRKLSVAFYARVARDPVLRPLFPGKTMTCAIEEFSAFLVQFLGGPSEDAQRRWWLSLRESHLRFKIGQKERDAWMANMVKTLEEAQIEEPVRGALREFFVRSSAYVVNQGPAPAVADGMGGEMGRRWDAQRRLDETVAAIRSGDADRAMTLAEKCDGAVLAGLLALMIGSGNRRLLAFVQEKVTRDPTLAQERYAGRSLLHVAAGADNLALVELMLRLGADPDMAGRGGHTPLYCAGNERHAGGGSVVRALVRAGANVDANDGVKHCTPLHMAARRGNVEVAEALLDCGADIEARDSLGETPLRRAVNCNKTAVASLLLARGADKHSKGSRKLTPVLAARSSAMKEILK